MPREPRRRIDIYVKAMDVFAQSGYRGASIAKIAKALGTSKASIYHYCSGKEDLFYKVYQYFSETRLIPIIEEAEKLPDPIERIAFVLKRITLLNATDKATRVLVPDIINLNKNHHSEIVSIWKKAYNVVCSSIRELQQSGKAPKFRESFLTLIGFGMANWTVFWFDYARQSNSEELAEALVQTFLYGLLRFTDGKTRNL
jgi:AcrR family transcriptional regulator